VQEKRRPGGSAKNIDSVRLRESSLNTLQLSGGDGAG
jgi:hypothetical protein